MSWDNYISCRLGYGLNMYVTGSLPGYRLAYHISCLALTFTIYQVYTYHIVNWESISNFDHGYQKAMCLGLRLRKRLCLPYWMRILS